MSLIVRPHAVRSIERPGAVTWFRGLFDPNRRGPRYSVKIPDTELRRIGHVSFGQPDTSYTREEFRLIKRHIQSRIRSGSPAQGRDPSVVLVTSARPGEGKSFVALNLALSLAIERDIGVTLVDGDVQGRDLSQRFNQSSGRGLLDLLGGSAQVNDIARDTNLGNLEFVPAGSHRADAAELLSSGRMANLMSELARRSSNHVVVVDSGAVLSGSPAIALAANAGQIAFVVSSNETLRAEIEESLTILDNAAGPLEDANIGLILNKTDSSQSPARYSAGRK